jgi:putative transposase
MRRIDEQYLKTPFYGSRRMAACLSVNGLSVNRKRVQRLMGVMDIQAIYPRRRTTQSDAEHRKYPYLLRGLGITRPDEVWAADITYIRMSSGFMYLVAIIDWHSRYVLSWQLSNSLESRFCEEVLERALQSGKPKIFNTDQGVQFTSHRFTGRLESAGVQVSMDGKGRALDNVFVERLWRSVKYEHVYLNEHLTVRSLTQGLGSYLGFFNKERPHQSLRYHAPWEVYSGRQKVAGPKPRP